MGGAEILRKTSRWAAQIPRDIRHQVIVIVNMAKEIISTKKIHKNDISTTRGKHLDDI